MEEQAPYRTNRPTPTIDPKELRIGNCVNFDGIVSRIFSIEQEQVEIINTCGCRILVPMWAISPIVLSEEIMHKTNLKKIAATSLCEYNQWVDKNGEEIIFQAFDNHFCHSLIQTSNNELFFLHRLQNLYFALKQKELKIKL